MWREWGEMIESLYLQQLADQAGNLQAVDQPVLRRSLATFEIDSSDYWAAESPVFSIDNEPVTGVSFTIHVGNSLRTGSITANLTPPDSGRLFPQILLKGVVCVSAILNYRVMERLRSSSASKRISFPETACCSKTNWINCNSPAPHLPGYAIKKPVQDGNNWKFDLELPRQTDLLISIFNSEGLNNYFEDFIAPAKAKVAMAYRLPSLQNKGNTPLS